MYVRTNVKLGSARVNTVTVEKSVTYPVCVTVVLFIQNKKSLRHNTYIAICGLSLDLQYFSTLSHKRHDFREKVLNIKCAFEFLYNFV